MHSPTLCEPTNNMESYEFLDLSDIEDSERKKLIRTLYNKNEITHDEKSNDRGLKLNTNKSIKSKGKSISSTAVTGITSYGTQHNTTATTAANHKKEYQNSKVNGANNEISSKNFKNLATTSAITTNNSKSYNIKKSSDTNNNINNNNNCQSQTQQLLSTNESGHLIRNLMFPVVSPQFFPTRLISPLPFCTIAKPTNPAIKNSINQTTNSSSTSAVVPLRTPIITAGAAAIKSYEEFEPRKNIYYPSEDFTIRKSTNHTVTKNSKDQLIENCLSSEEGINRDLSPKAIDTMAQHTQSSIHPQQQATQAHVQTIAQQQQNNNYLPPQHVAYTHVPSGVFMPTHGGTMYSMVPAQPNVYVNSVTANVNLNGWTAQTIPGTFVPGSTYMTQSDLSQGVVHEQIMQQVQHTNTIPRSNRRGRGGRNNNNRRNDYSQRNQQQEASPGPQDLTNSVDQSQSYHSYGSGYPYGTYPHHFFATQGLNHTQAQHATGTPLIMFSPSMYNCASGSIFYSPQHMMPQEYSILDDRNDDQNQQQQQHLDATGLISSQQHSQQMSWHPHVIPIDYQEEYDMNQVGIGDDINQNQSPLTASDHTPSMLSPTGVFQIHYDPALQQTIDVQQQMNALHLYDQQVVMAHQGIQDVTDEELQEQQRHIMQPMHEPGQVMMLMSDMNDYQTHQQIDGEQQDNQLCNNVQEVIPPEISQHPAQILTTDTHLYMQQQQQQQQQHSQIILIPSNNLMKHENLLILPDYNQNMVTEVPEIEEIVESEKNYVDEIPQTNKDDDTKPTIPQNNTQEEISSRITDTLVPTTTATFSSPQNSPQKPATTWTNQTKKLTASVAVTATPSQSSITASQKLMSAITIPPNKQNICTKEITILKNTTTTKNSSTSPITLPTNSTQLEKKIFNQQTEQKSIGSAVNPNQLQENIRKQETIIIENQAQKAKKSSDESKTQPLQSQQSLPPPPKNQSTGNLAPPPIASQTQTTTNSASSAQSWASLFANESPASNNNSQVNSTVGSTGYLAGLNAKTTSKPIAKVSPYEATSNIPTPQIPSTTPPINAAGALSYSAASARGISTSSTNVSTGGVRPKPVTSPQLQKSAIENSQDEWSLKFADFLRKYKTDFTPVSLRPRGLTNPVNYCYINSVLQALVACPPFYNLLKSLPKQSIALYNEHSKIPTINAMIQFANEFYNLPAGARINRREKGQKNKNEDFIGELQCDPAFEATSVYKLWNLSRSEIDEGRQGDAEEFLGFVLNKLNDEMLEILKMLAKPAASKVEENGEITDDGGDDWQMIYNNKNKGSVTRQADFGNTPISDIFRGELRSRIQREGEHSTDVIQPFFTLQLNIERAASVREALEILVGRDQLEGVTCSKTNQEVVAWQQMNLEKLPFVLILHLKWFDYKMDGCTKIVKTVGFPVELKIDTKVLASKKYTQKQKLYRLFAVVYHDGKEATKGHYITDVYHTGYASWLRCDDQNVKPISESFVLRPRGLRVPYLLYYRRSDTIITPPSTTTTTSTQQQQQQTVSTSATNSQINK